MSTDLTHAAFAAGQSADSSQLSDPAARITAASRRPASLGSVSEGAVSLAMGEPDGGTPASVIEAAARSLSSGRTRYTALAGEPALREAIAAHESQKHDIGLSAENIVITHGGSAGLAATILAVAGPGDTVLVPEPTYSLYVDQIAMVGANASLIAPTSDGGLDTDAIARLAPEARLLILCNPGNPTGLVHPNEDLDAVARILEDNPRLILLVDEAYSEIVFDGIEFVSALDLAAAARSAEPAAARSVERDATDTKAGIAEQIVCSTTFSKTYAMTGWRIGYTIAHEALAAKIGLVHRTINGAPNTFVQDAAIHALSLPTDALADSYRSRRDIVIDRLGEIPGVDLPCPQGAFYAFPRITSALSSTDIVDIFAEAGVLVRAGSEFGPSGEGHVRLSFATDIESLEEGLDRFVSALPRILAEPQHGVIDMVGTDRDDATPETRRDS